MSWAMVAVAGAALVGAVVSSDATKKAGRAQGAASSSAIAAQERAQQQFINRTQPFANMGLAAAPELANLLGVRYDNPEILTLQKQLSDLDKTIAAGPQYRKEGGGHKGGIFGGSLGALKGGLVGDPITGLLAGDAKGRKGKQVQVGEFDLAGLTAQREDLQSQIASLRAADDAKFEQRQARGPAGLDEINPLVSFLRDEGFQDIQDSAAARGRLGAGGTLKDLTKYNTNLAATVVPQLQNQRFNQLFNILGLGSNAATGQGTAALHTATNVGNLLNQQGANQANTAIQQGQNTQNLLGNLAGAFGGFQGAQSSTPPPSQLGTINSGGNFGAFA